MHATTTQANPSFDPMHTCVLETVDPLTALEIIMELNEAVLNRHHRRSSCETVLFLKGEKKNEISLDFEIELAAED